MIHKGNAKIYIGNVRIYIGNNHTCIRDCRICMEIILFPDYFNRIPWISFLRWFQGGGVWDILSGCPPGGRVGDPSPVGSTPNHLLAPDTSRNPLTLPNHYDQFVRSFFKSLFKLFYWISRIQDCAPPRNITKIQPQKIGNHNVSGLVFKRKN